jgi:hypothetical protein
MLKRRQHRLVAMLAGGVIATGAAVGVASATTGPAPHTLVNVVINDHAIKLSKKNVSDVTFVDFYIHNVGKLNHDMRIGRERSVVIHPGEREHFYVGFPVYGWYPYKVGLNGTPKMHGRFHINSPQAPD